MPCGMLVGMKEFLKDLLFDVRHGRVTVTNYASRHQLYATQLILRLTCHYSTRVSHEILYRQLTCLYRRHY